ncbi:IS982 family transposase [Acinetobacter corruptisaponis]|uniref:IS982 family transposase n=1 Tax=Acinetobacter corruptisaponis TaxID=3045147 RepID=A0ABY8S8V7_9GAMM|nr:IS982 family transposase [Acinetobacter sp. KCTC 92772]WHP06129.1 IS982 family transposase [Acinetobacter sp. KCTC 92772]
MYDFTEIFCSVDDFFKKFEPIYWQFPKQEKKRQRIRQATLSLSEIVTISICYKASQMHNFKAFFQLLCQYESRLFKELPCYKNILTLINQHQLAIHALHYALNQHKEDSYLWIDSTPLPVCKNKRIPKEHHALDDIASRGKSSMGWFYGCKLHLLMNHQGEIVNSDISNGHIADIRKVEKLVDGLSARVYGDRGYISQALKETLKEQGIDLITYPRKNMKVMLLPFSDEFHLRQRKRIETLIGLLKEKYHLVTGKHRSIAGFLSGVFSSLCAYQLCQKNKPQIHVVNSLAYP